MFRRYALLVFILLAAAMFFGNTFDTQNLWATTKPLLLPFASVYLSTFNSPATAILLCVLMAALAVALSFYYSSGRIWPTQRDLNTLQSELGAIESTRGSPATLEAVRRSLERRPRFQKAWRLYSATLFTDSDDRTWSSFQPSRTFNMRMLEHEGLRLRFYLGLPNDFVGLGLVFTFLGLVAGLYFASRSMMSADLTQAREALIQLLHAATFKFLTSIVGIAISLILSTVQRLQLERLQSSLDEVQLRLEELLPPLSIRPDMITPAANNPQAIRSIAS